MSTPKQIKSLQQPLKLFIADVHLPKTSYVIQDETTLRQLNREHTLGYDAFHTDHVAQKTWRQRSWSYMFAAKTEQQQTLRINYTNKKTTKTMYKIHSLNQQSPMY